MTADYITAAPPIDTSLRFWDPPLIAANSSLNIDTVLNPTDASAPESGALLLWSTDARCFYHDSISVSSHCYHFI